MHLEKFRDTLDMEDKLQTLSLTDEYTHSFKGIQSYQVQAASALFQELGCFPRINGGKWKKVGLSSRTPNWSLITRGTRGPLEHPWFSFLEGKQTIKPFHSQYCYNGHLSFLNAMKSVFIKCTLLKRHMFSRPAFVSAVTNHVANKIKKSLRIFLSKTNLQDMSRDRLLQGSMLGGRFGIGVTSTSLH